MKKYFTLTILLALRFFAEAQPSISSNVFPLLGDTIYRSLDTILVAPGNAGPNVTWNFSSLPSHVNVSRIYVSPAATPYGTTFPNAALCRTDAIGSNYTYWNNSSTKSVYYGFVEPNKYDQNYNSLPPNFYVFPMTYGSSHTDSVSSITNPGSVAGSGKYYFNADAWGTLQLPNRTVSNVLRTKSVLYIGDSSINSYSLSTDYAWYEANVKDPILIISTVIVNKALYKKFVFFDNRSSTTGLESIGSPDNFLIWPNPVNDVLHISLNSPPSQISTCKIIDLTGKLIVEHTLGEDRTINLSGLPANLYFIEVRTTDEVKQQLFRKE